MQTQEDNTQLQGGYTKAKGFHMKPEDKSISMATFEEKRELEQNPEKWKEIM